jgi:hypothetical protein
MADLVEVEQWDLGVYQLETTDPVQGGADGVDNTPHKALANRTLFLKSTKAEKGGDNTQSFKVADATLADEALSKGQLLTEMKAVDGIGSGLDADLVRGLPADFTSNKSGSGYQNLPSGLIIQWGKIILSDTTTVNGTFPITFPTGCLQIAGGAVQNQNNMTFSISATDSSSYSATGGTTGTPNLSWLAIGY